MIRMMRHRRVLQIGLYGVIAAFVLTSVFVGTMGGGSDRTDAVASVNGEPIPVERYQRRYEEYTRVSKALKDLIVTVGRVGTTR